MDQTFVAHFIKKIHVYYLKCREGEKERLIFLNAEEKITKVRKKKEETYKNTQKKERKKKKKTLTLSILILRKKKILFLVGLLINWYWQ